MEWLLPALVWLVIGGWVYSDAKERGSSSPIGWAIGVLALMIVFLPLYFIMRPSKRNAVNANNTSRLCPYCGKYYEGILAFCPNCGHSLGNVNSKEVDK